MQINTMPRVIDRVSGAGGSTYDSANRMGSHPADAAIGARHAGDDAQTARDAALSALRNDRFGTMLEQISDPQASETLALMWRDAESGRSDFNSAAASYAENSE